MDFKYSIIEGFHPVNDAALLNKAEALAPVLHHRIKEPVGGFKLKERYSSEAESFELQSLSKMTMGKGENLCLDFGTHYVGYVTLQLGYTGSHPDAPAYLKLKFAETFKELYENSNSYDGWLSKSWIQEEYIHVDTLPATIKLERRYAFRYLKLTMVDTSPKYKLTVKQAELMTESAVDLRTFPVLETGDPVLDKMDRVGLRTLGNCMQNVFEDGPKRDQRLWLGDLRLQALSNYASYKHYDLVKRCLYLFAGSRFPDGRISACLFVKPTIEADDTYMFDYALFFVVTLVEYLEETGDEEALEDLYPIAMEQLEIAGLAGEDLRNTTFVDWCSGLDKTACAQAILVYALRYGIRLAELKKDANQKEKLENYLKKEIFIAKAYWDPNEECFLSNGQKSFASQIWMILAGVPDRETSIDLLHRMEEFSIERPMATPYMHHQHIMALLECGLKEEALTEMKAYWGSMLDIGVDTFYEAWDPKNPDASPYGSPVVNSYCHAWSCTPVYLIRKFFMNGKKKS